MSAGGRILTERELNRALLARQFLLERSAASLPKAVEGMGELQAQYAPSIYVALWSRMQRLGREQVDRALERRSVVQGTLMRATIHLVSARDYWPIAIGIRRSRREAWLKASYRRDYSAGRLSAAARKLRRRLEAEGTIRRNQMHELLGSDSVVTNGVNMWLDLVRVPPSGTWERRRADLYALAEDWVGAPPALEEADGIELLARRYLAAFGPASLEELANWAGLPPQRVAPAIERLSPRRFAAEDGTELLDLPRAPLPDPETPAPPRFLPNFDATLLVHARRTGILPEEHRPKVFNTKTPHSMPTFLIDGRIAGAWRYEKGKVKLEPFEKLDAADSRELGAEADRLADLHA